MCALYGFLVVFRQSLKCSGYTLKRPKNLFTHCQWSINTIYYAAATWLLDNIFLTDQLYPVHCLIDSHVYV